MCGYIGKTNMLSRKGKWLNIGTEIPTSPTRKLLSHSAGLVSPSPDIFNRHYMPSPVLGADCSALGESDFYALLRGVHDLMKEIGNKKVKQTYYNENML